MRIYLLTIHVCTRAGAATALALDDDNSSEFAAETRVRVTEIIA